MNKRRFFKRNQNEQATFLKCSDLLQKPNIFFSEKCYFTMSTLQNKTRQPELVLKKMIASNRIKLYDENTSRKKRSSQKTQT